MNILIVDDGKEKRHSIRDAIRYLDGVETASAGSYFSARRKLFKNSGAYDLAVIDMFLPDAEDDDEIRGLAGKDLIFDMRDCGIEIPVIVVTQYTDYGEKYSGREAYVKGTHPFLENPYYRQELKEFRTKEYDCTYYEGLHEYLVDEVPNYLGIVYYSNQRKGWEESLRYLINKARKQEVEEESEHTHT